MATLRDDALEIWRAAVAAVDSERLVRDAVRRDGKSLIVAGHAIDLSRGGRIAVVGGGKAASGMAAGFESAVGDDLLPQVTGWVNVPEGTERDLQRIHTHAARPAGLNEPTAAGVHGTNKILEIVRTLTADDVCVVLLSGGGSALLPAPVEGITLEDLQAVTSFLMSSGAPIEDLNCVRKPLSRIQGGRLANAIGAGQTIVLIISDVVGNPLDVIASGPTVTDRSTADDAIRVLHRYAREEEDLPSSVWDTLAAAREKPSVVVDTSRVHNHVIGNNQVALDAAATRATELGYRVHSLGSANRGDAKAIGTELAELSLRVRGNQEPIAPPACILSGGEPTVALARTDKPRKGGRNQEVALSALKRLWDDGLRNVAILSGGTDGEDGPTDAAGAIADSAVLERAGQLGLDPREFLAINNSYPFFEATGGLIKTGPTHTNVMDVRVALIGNR